MVGIPFDDTETLMQGLSGVQVSPQQLNAPVGRSRTPMPSAAPLPNYTSFGFPEGPQQGEQMGQLFMLLDALKGTNAVKPMKKKKKKKSK